MKRIKADTTKVVLTLLTEDISGLILALDAEAFLSLDDESPRLLRNHDQRDIIVLSVDDHGKSAGICPWSSSGGCGSGSSVFYFVILLSMTRVPRSTAEKRKHFCSTGPCNNVYHPEQGWMVFHVFSQLVVRPVQRSGLNSCKFAVALEGLEERLKPITWNVGMNYSLEYSQKNMGCCMTGGPELSLAEISKCFNPSPIRVTFRNIRITNIVAQQGKQRHFLTHHKQKQTILDRKKRG
jgi:hypothetical protein